MNNTIHSASRKVGRIVLCLLGAAAGAVVLTGSTCSIGNKAPSVPVISGPSAGVVGVPVTFKATATDPEGDSIAYQFDWGDTTTPTWSAFIATGETLSVAHSYADSGSFSVTANVRDPRGGASAWAGGHALRILAKAGGLYPDSVYAEIAIVGGGCAGAITPDGRYLYAASGYGSMKVTPIRLSDRTVLPAISMEANPRGIVSSVDGTHIYVTLDDADKVVAIRTSDNTIDREASVVHSPMYIAPTPDGQMLVVTVMEPFPGHVLFLHTDDLSVVDTAVAGSYPEAVVVDRDGRYAYTTSAQGVRVLDLDSRNFVDSVTSVPNPGILGLSRDGKRLYASTTSDSGFDVIRLSDRTVEARVNLHAPRVGTFAATLNDGYVMVTYYRGIQYVDTRAYAVVDSFVNPAESWRALVMHPTADTMYMIGWNKVYIIGPR